MSEDKKQLMNRLREYMDRYNYTQREIAEKFEVDESTVSRWFQGGNITKKHVSKIEFFISGHPSEKLGSFVCNITGRDKCPMDPDDHMRIAAIKKIMQLDDEQLSLLILKIEQLKKQNKELPASEIKAG